MVTDTLSGIRLGKEQQGTHSMLTATHSGNSAKDSKEGTHSEGNSYLLRENLSKVGKEKWQPGKTKTLTMNLQTAEFLATAIAWFGTGSFTRHSLCAPDKDLLYSVDNSTLAACAPYA